MGKIWEHHECVVLCWNHDKCVTGIKIDKSNNKLSVIDSAVSKSDTELLAVALSEVVNSIVTSETHLMLAGGNIPGSVSFDINLPKMSVPDMRQAISYELPRHIPCNPQDVVFGYRVISTNDDPPTSGKQTVRILAVMKKQWNELLSELTGSGIRIDAIITPSLVLDPLLGDDETVSFYDSDECISCMRSSEYSGRRILVHDLEDEEAEAIPEDEFKRSIKKLNYEWENLPPTIKKEPEIYFPALLIAAYGVTREYTLDKNSLIKLPSELIPERYRTLRISFFALIATILLLLLMLVGRFWWEAKERFDKIDNEIKRVKSETTGIEAKKRALQSNAEIIKELMETQKGNPEIATCLHKIAMTLPRDMWLANFSSRDDSINISIKYTKSGLVVPDLNKTKIMKVIGLDTRSNPRDGSTNVYIRLTYIPPERRNEQK